MQSTCPASKVRTYECADDGNRLVKYINFVYNAEEDNCEEKIKSKKVACTASQEKKTAKKSSKIEEKEEAKDM